MSGIQNPEHPNLGGILRAVTVLLAVFGSTLQAAERTPWTSGRITGSPYPPPPYTVQRIHESLAFNNPVDLSFEPGGRRLFVAEQSGKLWSIDTGQSNRPAELAIDLRKHHRPFDSLLAFAFHPGYATNRFIFINYNEPGGRENGAHVSRFKVSRTEPPTIDPASEQVVIRWLSGGHNGCTLVFGSDQYLYISTGDADDPDPPDGKRKTGQDNSDLLASILRIDVNRSSGSNAYAIPADNPFVGDRRSRPEVWAFGFRNPYRMSVDRATGDLWVGDVGWEMWEMIYRVQRGGNYGWPIAEGPNRPVRTDVTQGPGEILPAVVALPHSDAASITGGHVYHGRRHEKLRGAYVYGDWETGKFWALRHNDGKLISNEELCDTSLKPAAFALTPEGELVILDYGGGLYEFAANAASHANESFPRRLRDSGLFQTTRPLRPAAGTVPYRVAAPMWNDHAIAEWLMAIPGTASITTSGGVGNIAGGTWAFPTNTVLGRTLTLEFEAGRADSAKPVETQILHWDGQAWNPYTYRWRPDGTDADLVGASGTNETFLVKDSAAPGGTLRIPWRFMTRAECLRCHNAWSGDSLTLNWLQLGSPDAPESQLMQLANAGLIRLRNAPKSVAPLAYPYDDSFPLAERARSWLHVNCGTCHRFGAGGAVAIHLNFEKKDAELRAINQKPLRGDFGLADARIIAAGDPHSSSLYYRLRTEGAGRMPHIGSRHVDPHGSQIIREWINSLPGSSSIDQVANLTLSNQLAQLTSGTETETRTAIRSLLASMNGSLRLLDETIGNPRLAGLVADLAANHTNLLVRDLFQSLQPIDRRRETLGTEIDPASITSIIGDATRGRVLFFGAAQCSQCHAVGGEGRAFGPDLAGISRRYSRSQLLEQILEPSKIIAPEFRTVTVTIEDDRELIGMIVRRTNEAIVIKDQNLVEHRVPSGQIVELRESALSAMAEGLLAALTAQEAADLLDFLLRTPAP